MFFLLTPSIFLLSIIIKSSNSTCNSSEFFPCACCDPAFHLCVHNAINPFCHISTCKLDTSIYCCVPKERGRIEEKNDNITLFNKYCKKNINIHDPIGSLVNTIISSCDPISKRCYDLKHSFTPALLPIPKRLPGSIILSPPKKKHDVNEITISTLIPEKIIYENEDNENKNNLEGEINLTNQTMTDNQQIEEVTTSILIPEEIDQSQNSLQENDSLIQPNENTNRASIEFQSLCSLILISIINIVVFTIN